MLKVVDNAIGRGMAGRGIGTAGTAETTETAGTAGSNREKQS
jgi:hypothetical protein